MLYLFGFVGDRGHDGVTLPEGVLGAPRIVPLDGDRSAVVAEISGVGHTWDDPSAEQTAAAVLHHDAVLTACLELDVVPARFGTLVDDQDALDAVGQLHRIDVTTALARIRGRAEYDVRMPVRRPVARSGAAYLRQRRAELTGGVCDADLAALQQIVSDVVERRATRDERRIAVLANAGERDRLRDHLVSVPGAEILGPYPPYSFCGGIGGDVV